MSASARVGAETAPGPLPVGSLVGGRFALEQLISVEAQTGVYVGRDTSNPSAAHGQEEGPAHVRVVVLPFAQITNRGVLHADLGRAQRVGHRSLLSIMAFGEHQECAFVVSEALDGHTLRQVIDGARAQGRPVGPRTAHALLAHVAQGMSAAYEALAHGALTPSAIIVGRAGRLAVADLGIARGCPALAWRGKPAGASEGIYIAPELGGGAPPTAASDVYSLAVILYELLTGVPPSQPYRAPSHLAGDVPQAVDGLMARALSATPQSRPPTPAALVDELSMTLGIPSPAGSQGGAHLSASSSGALPQLSSGSGLAVPRVTGRTFNAAAAAGLDADTERWLIQKNRLDYGPYSMAQVMAEIERGAFSSEHFIVDTDSGDRQKIGEHPQLSEFAKQAERKLEQVRRAQAEQSLEKVEKKKSRVTVVVVGAAIAVIAAGGALYLNNRRAAGADTLASRVGDADIDAFLKNVKLGFAQKKRPTAVRRAGGGGPKGADDFSNDMVLGDVTKGGGDEVLSEGEVQQVMMGNYRRLIPCIMEERRRSPGTTDFDMDFVVLGSGKVSKVKVNGQQNGPLPSCLLGRMQSFGFRKFNGAKSVASWSMSVR